MITRPALPTQRRRRRGWLLALPLSVAGCTDEVAAESTADALPTPDTVEAETSPDPDGGGPGFVLPDPHPGDPLTVTGSSPLAAPLALGSMTAVSGGGLVVTGTEVRRVSSDGVLLGEPVLTSPDALLAVEQGDDDVYAVSRNGTWRRASDGKEVAGPRVISLHAVGDDVVGLLGAAGIAVASGTLDDGPLTSAIDGSVVRDLTMVGNDVVIAGGPAGVQRVVIGADRRVTAATRYPTSLPVTAVAALGADRLVAVEAGASIQVLALEQGGFTKLGSLEHEGPGLDVAVLSDADSALAVIADTDRVTLVDLRDPAAPRWVATEPFGTNGALGVIPAEMGVLVRGISNVTSLAPDLDAIAPVALVEPALIQIEALAELDAGASGVLLRNPGALPLEVTGLSLSDPRLTVNTGADAGEALVVDPGDVAFFEIRVAGTAPLDATLTFQTNAIDAPTVTVPIEVNPPRLAAGDLAPPFTLVGTEGELITIGELMGSVIHAKLFNAY
ncbi:MAG: hypothetical protein IV100_18345 [Myxococcales bacterium]|nr:hypothetical protein [Myxococcales bacterium]